MFAKSIVLSDAFLDMPVSARLLYFTLGMVADDDGFVNSPKAVMRQIGSTADDISVLITKHYVIAFEDGVVVIKHWRINNYLQKDRINPTTYFEHKNELSLDGKGAYVRQECDNVYTEAVSVYTQDRLGKDRLDKDKDNKRARARETFTPPTVDEVKAYCTERGNNVDAERFCDFYASKGWRVGNQPMRDWKAAVRNWERSDKREKPTEKPGTFETDEFFGAALKRSYGDE